MKQGKPLITFVIAALAVALAIYFGVYVFNSLDTPYETTLTYPYTSNDSVRLEGLIVREEEVLPTPAGILEVTRAEGEKVGVGQTVALAYRDSQAQADQAQIQALELEIELLRYSAAQSGDVASAARLDEDILQSMVALRASTARGDFAALEDQVLEVKSRVLKRSYTYGDGTGAALLSEQLQALRGQLAALQSRSAATTQVTAPRSGTYSNLVDGYEGLLSPATAAALTPSSLAQLMSDAPREDPASAGKLIVSDRWQFVTSMPLEAAQRLREGEMATIRFTGDFSQDISMRVDQIGPEEGQDCLVIFSTDRYLAQTTLLRQQTVELIFDSWSGLRIPKQALRLVERTTQDPDTGEDVTQTLVGVYSVVARRIEFKQVQIAAEGSDYYVVRPMGSGRKILRAGDEIVTQAVGIEDGLLLEY